MLSPSHPVRLCTIALILFPGLACLGEGLTLKVVEAEPPKELDASIRAVLQSKAVQLLDGSAPVLEFWLRAEVPLQAKPESTAKGLNAVKQATLLGAVAVRTAQRDYKDSELVPGIHTMRFALQPEDGNHLGTADYPYFLVLVPAKLDGKLDGLTDYKPLVKASSRESSTGHPIILSLRPPDSESGEAPALREPAADHKSVRLKLPAKVGSSGETTALVFELVYQGTGHL
jgi:hypothetical protein